MYTREVDTIENVEVLRNKIYQMNVERQLLEKKLAELTIENTLLKKKNESVELFSDFLSYWVEYHKPNIDETTYDSYRLVLDKHIIPYFSARKLHLNELTPWSIQEYYDNKVQQGLSGNTILKHHSNIHSALKLAVRMGKIDNNPSDKVALPKKIPYRASYYTPNEIIQLLSVAREATIYNPILLSAILGLRRSEALGLTWDSVNLSSGSITVERKVVPFVSMKGISIQDKVKTAASYRTLPLPTHFMQYLTNLKEVQRAQYPQNPFLCIDKNGTLLKPDYVTKSFSSLLKRNNLQIIRFHDLRHSCASLLTSLGFSLKQIQDWLGHSDIQTTAKYAHVYCYDKEGMADKINQTIHFSV